MNTSTVKLHVPKKYLQYGWDASQIQQHLEQWLVFSLFTEGTVSSGKAAELLSMTRLEFLDLLRERGIAYLNYDDDELAEEVDAVHHLKTVFSDTVERQNHGL